MATSITGQGIAAYKAPDDALSSESKNAVQNKVIDEELSDVKNAIDQLDNRVDALEDGGSGESAKPVSEYGTFQNGGLNNGVIYPGQKYRVACADTITLEKTALLLADDGFLILVAIFDGTTYKTSYSWIRSFVIPENTPFKIAIKRITEDTSETADISLFTSKVIVKLQSGDVNTDIKILNNQGFSPITELSLFCHGMVYNGQLLLDRQYAVSTGLNVIYCQHDVTIYCSNEFSFAVQYFEDGAFSRLVDGLYGQYTVPAGSYIRMQIRRRTEDRSEIADIAEFTAALTFKVPIVDSADKAVEIQRIKSLGNDTALNFWTFINGVLVGGSVNRTQAYRIVTQDILHFDYDAIIYIDDGFYVAVSYYDENGTYIKMVDNIRIIGRIPAGSNVRMCISRIQSVTSEIADIATFTSKVHVETNLVSAIESFNQTKAVVDRLSSLDAANVSAYATFANGRIVNGNFDWLNGYQYRVSSVLTIVFPYDVTIRIDAGFHAAVFALIEGAWVDSGWLQGAYDISSGSEVMIMIERVNQSSSEVADVDEYTSAVKVYTKITTKLLDSPQYHADGDMLDVKRSGYDVRKLFACPAKHSQGWPQGMCIYNGVIAQFCSSPDDTMHLIDLSDGTVLASLTSDSGHGNSANFSTEFYASGDEFPLCYVSTQDASNACAVIRISREGNELIRKIVPDDLEHTGYAVTYAIDVETNSLWSIGYYVNNWQQATGNHMIFSRWSLDNMAEVGTGVFKPTYIEGFTMPYIGGAVQGIRYFNNRLWILQTDIAHDPQVYTNIFVVDTNMHRYSSVLSEFPLDIKNYESESIDFVLNESGDKYDLILLTTEHYYRITFA